MNWQEIKAIAEKRYESQNARSDFLQIFSTGNPVKHSNGVPDQWDKIAAVVDAAIRECWVDGDGYRRQHVSEDLIRALEDLEK